MMNNTPKSGKSNLPESMQRMITPQYEQIVNEIETIYHHPDTGKHPSRRLHRSTTHVKDWLRSLNGSAFPSQRRTRKSASFWLAITVQVDQLGWKNIWGWKFKYFFLPLTKENRRWSIGILKMPFNERVLRLKLKVRSTKTATNTNRTYRCVHHHQWKTTRISDGKLHSRETLDNACDYCFRVRQRCICFLIFDHWAIFLVGSLAWLCLDYRRCVLGLLNYLTTEISSSKQKKFPLVSFIDTPGLVDGAMAYPFDVEQAILWLGLSDDSFSRENILLHHCLQVITWIWSSCSSIPSVKRSANERWRSLNSWTNPIHRRCTTISPKPTKLEVIAIDIGCWCKSCRISVGNQKYPKRTSTCQPSTCLTSPKWGKTLWTFDTHSFSSRKLVAPIRSTRSVRPSITPCSVECRNLSISCTMTVNDWSSASTKGWHSTSKENFDLESRLNRRKCLS